MTHHTEILTETLRVLKDRTEKYGQPKDSYSRAAIIASTILQKDLSAYDIIMIMHSVKMSRLPTDRNNIDNYVDPINYLSFAAELATMPRAPEQPKAGARSPLEDLARQPLDR